MATFFQDSFTDTQGVALPSHTPETGTWAYDRQYNGGSAPVFSITSANRVRLTTISNGAVSSVVTTQTPGQQAHTVEVDLVRLSAAAVGVAAGLILCFDSTNYNHYLGRLDLSATPTWQLYRWNGSSPTLLGSSTTGANNTSGTYRLRLSIDGSGNLLFSYSTDGGSTYNTAVSVNNASPLPYGKVGLHMAGNSGTIATDTTGYQFDNFLATNATVSATAYTLSATPTTVGASTPATITATSNGNLSSPVTITLSDGSQGGNFSGTIILPAGNLTSGTATYSNASIKTVTISGSNNGGLTDASTNVTIANLVQINPGNSNYFVSPYNSAVVNNYAKTNSPGFYIKARFTGTATASINVDVSSLVGAGVTSTDYPSLRWLLSNGNWQSIQLTPSTTSVSLATELTTGTTYDLELYFWKVGNYNLDRWTTPVNSIGFGAITIDAAGSFLAPTLRSKRGLFFGDSITEGLLILPAHSATDDYAFHLGLAQNAEYGVRGFGSWGWEWAGSGNVPKFSTTWNQLWNGQAMSFASAPDFIVVLHGTNDALNSVADATVQADVQAWLTAARTAAGANCLIYVCVPFGGFKRSAITAGFNAYVAATPSDTKVKLVDLGNEAQKGVTSFALGSNAYSNDGIHPNQFNHARLAAMMAAQINNPGSVTVNATNFINALPRIRRRGR